MSHQRHSPKSFPVDAFVQQYNTACHGTIRASQVHVRALRSKKHATAEVIISTTVSGRELPNQDIVIAKHFADAEKGLLYHEQVVHSHAMSSGIPVPRILHVLDNFIVLEKVEGSTLMDTINDGSLLLERKKEAIAGLGSWLSSFHAAFASHPRARRRGDANLRNFIVTGAGAIVGLDFEEAGLEDPVVDLHEVVDSILQSDPGIYSDGMPAIEWKFDLCECFLRSYAAAARKPPIEVIKDPAGFVDAQLRVMRDLAAIRGNTSALLPLVPGIKKELVFRISSLLRRSGR
jgi:tRNA A-37 threonylcarbamoyl transferase component Bud32